MSSLRCSSCSVSSALAAPSAVGNFQTVMVAIYISSGGFGRTGRSGDQELRIWLFSSSNSASSSTPESRSSASCRSCASLVLVSVRGGPCGAGPLCGAGSAYCGSGAASSCWCDHRFAWRRDTLLDTAVAVPATTAVRAIPRSSPGMSRLLRSVCAGRPTGWGRNRWSAGRRLTLAGTGVHEGGEEQQQAEEGDLDAEDQAEDEHG